MWTLYEGDCLDVMPQLQDKSIDMILCDLPYGTTACKWDTVIPFEPLWQQYKRLIKPNGAIVLTASQPFTSALVMSNPKWFRYEVIWEKDNFTNLGAITRQFGKVHENILIFYEHLPVYHPQMWESSRPCTGGVVNAASYSETSKQAYRHSNKRIGAMDRYPRSVIKITRPRKPIHPTQKPVALFEYLIRTYTNEGDTVLDNCAGSGTTGVACENTGRHSILIEREPKYCNIIRERMNALQGRLFM